MKLTSRFMAVGASALIAGGLAVLPASGAFAASPPACSTASPAPTSASAPNSGTGGQQGGDCSVSGTIQVGSVLAFEANVSAFNLTASNTADPNTFAVFIGSNDASGYRVDEAAENPAFQGPGTNTIPDSQVQAVTLGTVPATGCPGAGSSQALSASAFNVVTVGKVSGGYHCGTGVPTGITGFDSFNVGGWFMPTIPTSLPAGTYANTVDLALWGA